mmetsp:Transcript_11821/g.18205  ORF Transcript_11821/g.18205 Transcript_11821/m.18205 type:complete len:272 (+) Transcript_11821:948-1763(+)
MVLVFSLKMIVMLQRTRSLGELIMMVSQMINELKKFLFTFGLLIIGAVVVTSQLKLELLKDSSASFYQVALYIFNAINGNQEFENYNYPQGKIFIAVFAYLFNILLLSFLVSMFINRYKYVYFNIDALRRMNVIKLKNSSSYDPTIGGATLAFFPVNFFLLPFLPFFLFFRSERFNEFILKTQYFLMIVSFCLIAIVIAIPIYPLLYLKCVGNAFYILTHNKRAENKWGCVFSLIFTILFNPFILLLALLVDLVSLPSLLLKEEREFEFKY